MALTQAQIINVCISTFNAAPGAANLANLEAWVAANPDATTVEFAEALGALPEFAAQFEGMEAQAKAEAMAANFGLEAGTTGGDAAIAYFLQEIEAGTSDAAMLGVANDFLLDSDAETLESFGLTAAKAVLQNKAEVATYYSVEKGISGDTIADLKATVASVTADAATVTAAKGAVDGETPAEPSELTLALGELKGAQDAKADWAEALALDMNFDGKEDAGDYEAGDLDATTVDAAVDTYLGTAATTIAAEGYTSLAKADYEDMDKTALQDADMETALTKANADVSFATSNAKTGMTALIEAAESAQKDYKDALDTEVEATTAYNSERAAFLVANETDIEATTGVDAIADITDVIFMAESDYSATADYRDQLLIIDDTMYVGENGVAFADITDSIATADLARFSQLSTANDELETAEEAVTSLLGALQDAVGEVYVLETGGHSLKTIGTDGNAVTAADGSIDFTATDVEVYKTAADAAAEVTAYEVTFGAFDNDGDGGAASAASKITFDGIDVSLGATDLTGAEVAALVAAKTYNNYTVEYTTDEAVVTFIPKTTTGEAVEAADFAFDTDGDATLAATTVAEAAELVDIGDTFSAAASKADALQTAIDDLEALEEAIADFEAARETKQTLEEQNDAITDAELAITNDADDADIPGLDMNLRDFGTENATTSDDVFVFADDIGNSSTPVTITNFGKAGSDYLYFGGDFSLVELAEDQTMAKNVGDAAELEIFWEQSGSDLKLYVEAETFAGNSASDAEITYVTLTGVSMEDVTFEDGFLTIA